MSNKPINRWQKVEPLLPPPLTIPCLEVATSKPPVAVKQGRSSRVEGRVIQEWGIGFGGATNPQFFGLKLGATGDYEEEYLILTIPKGSDWLLFDEKHVTVLDEPETRNNLRFDASNPLFILGERDLLTSHLVGAGIWDVYFHADFTEIKIISADDGLPYVIELPLDGKRLAIDFSIPPRFWNPADIQYSAWVFVKDGRLGA